MKKVFVVTLLCLSVLLGFVGCKKEEGKDENSISEGHLEYTEQQDILIADDMEQQDDTITDSIGQSDIISDKNINEEIEEQHTYEESDKEYQTEESDTKTEVYDQEKDYKDPTSSDTEKTELKDIVKLSNTVYAQNLNLVASVSCPSGTSVVQGGWTDGQYLYQAFLRKDMATNEAENDVVIVKYDLNKKQIVKQSEKLKLNHANDITYNSKLGYFVVCHNNPNRTTLSYLDPENFTIVKSFTIGYSIFSIDYNATYNRYVVGIAGGQTFRILDENFNSVGGVYQPTSETVGCVTQGVACDNDYIYFALYNPNVVAVYDWNGSFVTLVRYRVFGEPENISVINDKIYVTIANSGANVYLLGGFSTKE